MQSQYCDINGKSNLKPQSWTVFFGQQSSSCLNDDGSGTRSEIVPLVTTKGEIHIML